MISCMGHRVLFGTLDDWYGDQSIMETWTTYDCALELNRSERDKMTRIDQARMHDKCEVSLCRWPNWEGQSMSWLNGSLSFWRSEGSSSVSDCTIQYRVCFGDEIPLKQDQCSACFWQFWSQVLMWRHQPDLVFDQNNVATCEWCESCDGTGFILTHGKHCQAVLELKAEVPTTRSPMLLSGFAFPSIPAKLKGRCSVTLNLRRHLPFRLH